MRVHTGNSPKTRWERLQAWAESNPGLLHFSHLTPSAGFPPHMTPPCGDINNKGAMAQSPASELPTLLQPDQSNPAPE